MPLYRHRAAADSICNLQFNVFNEIIVVFHRGLNYDYHFMMKKLTNEFEGKFGCIGEDKDKYKTFFVPLQKEIRKIDQEGNETFETISYKIKFIDSAKFMASSSSNLTEGTHKIKCKNCDCFSEYKRVKGNLINA